MRSPRRAAGTGRQATFSTAKSEKPTCIVEYLPATLPRGCGTTSFFSVSKAMAFALHCSRLICQGNPRGTMITDVKLVSTAVVRNCCRCGEEFRIHGKGRICLACRKPKQPKPKPKLKSIQRHLTFREKQIVDLVSQAKLNKEIAYELHLSEGTIKEYLFQIF